MTINVTWLSHACLLIDTGDATLLVDPFITGNPLAPIAPDAIQADYILVSHGHGDHVGDTVAIAQRTGATVISNFEIHNWLLAQGVEKAHPQHIGGGFDYPWGRVKLTIAHHGSGLPDGSYGGMPNGVIVTGNGPEAAEAFGDQERARVLRATTTESGSPSPDRERRMTRRLSDGREARGLSGWRHAAGAARG